ncbi:hypothetical protein LSCM1_07974 [Leishmania martiniquensis]|uniref:Protein kinase n=1 Tax=Leishmania martiniquensis TaxID=1580590 RepID=A0A836HM96_9TRYP|nr:hypothetical protein LSCM1_07974 [Leishmania martiniquensis]
MQLPQLRPALAGATGVGPRDTAADLAAVNDESSSGYENVEASRRLYDEGDGDAGAHSADYGGDQRRLSGMHNAPQPRSSVTGRHSVLEPRTSVAPLSFPSLSGAAPASCSNSAPADGTAAGHSASVPLPPVYAERLRDRMVHGCSPHRGAARADEPAEEAFAEDDDCRSDSCECLSLRRISAALLSTTPHIAPGFLLALIGVITGVLLFLPWSRNPVHVTLMVLSGVVGCVCGLVYYVAERRWRRRRRHAYDDASGSATVYCGAGGAPGWHEPSVYGSAAPQYYVHDADDEASSEAACCGSDTLSSCCCTAGCASRCIDRQHFRVVLPTVQLLLLGVFVLVSPQVMPTWTATTAPTSGLGGGAIVADGGAGLEARYGATLYPIEAVWKCSLLHAWMGMGFALPLLWSFLVGLAHMAVLLAQHQHAGPGTLLTLVAWMSVPLLCFTFLVCISRPRPALAQEQLQRQRLRVLAAGERGMGYSTNSGVGAGAPLPLLASLSISRGRDAFGATHPSMSYSGPSSVMPAAPARAASYSSHPFRPAVLPPPPVAAYSSVSYTQTPSVRRAGDTGVTRPTAGGYANLVRSRGVRAEAAQHCGASYGDSCTAMARGREADAQRAAPQHPVRPPYDAAAPFPAASVQQGAPLSEPELFAGSGVPLHNSPTSLAFSVDTPLPPPYMQARDPSASAYSPRSPPHAAREMRFESAHGPISAVGGARHLAAPAAATFPTSEDGAPSSVPPPLVSRQLDPPPHSPIASMRAGPAAVVSSLEPTPQSSRWQEQQQQHTHVQQTLAGGDEEARVLRGGAAATATAPIAPSPWKSLPQRDAVSAAAKKRRARYRSAAAAASAAGDEGCASGVAVADASLHGHGDGGEESDGELLLSDGASLEDTCAPYLVLDCAFVIVGVSPPLCRLLGTTVDAILFRRLPDVLVWLDVVEREAVMRLVSAVAQPLRTAARARGEQKCGTGGHPARKESASAKKGRRKKGRSRGNRHDDDAEGGVRHAAQYGDDPNHNVQAETAKQLQRPSDSEAFDDVAEGAPVRRVTLRGRCPYYANGSGCTRDSSTSEDGGLWRPPFALCFDVWAERLAAPAANAAGTSLRDPRFCVVGGGPLSPAPFAIILRRPLLHGLCDALPLPLALVHPRTGEVLCWNRYVARLTGCAAYDMLGTSAYSGFLYEAPPVTATTAASQEAFSSSGRHFPPTSPRAEPIPSAHRLQCLSNMTALGAATRIGTVPGGEVASHALSRPPVESTTPTTAALQHPSPHATSPAVLLLPGARPQRQHGGAGESSPPNADDLNGAFASTDLQRHCVAPLPGFFHVPFAGAATALASAELNFLGHDGGPAATDANGSRGARQSSTGSIGRNSFRISPPELPWSLAGRGGGGSGSGNDNASGSSAGARCLRPPPPPPPPLEGRLRGTSAYDEVAASATASDADKNKRGREHGGEGDDDVAGPLYRHGAAAVRGLLFRSTLRPLRGALCSEEAGVVENLLGGPLQMDMSALDAEHAGRNAAVAGEAGGEGRMFALEGRKASADHNSGSDDGGEAVLSERHLERRQQRRRRTGRRAAGARMRNSGCEEDSGAEDQSDMDDDDDDDDIPFDENDLSKGMAATVNGGLPFAATLEQLFATKSVLCNLGLDKESAGGPRRSAASTATTTATAAPGALLNSELLPQYSLREALEELAASDAPLLLTLSEPPVYATACASAEALLQERRLSHQRVSSMVSGERGYSRAPTLANNGGDCVSVLECCRGKSPPPPPQSSLLHRQRPQVPALWGDGSASLQFVAAVREAVESYRESIEEDASGYTDLLGLLSLSGERGCAAHSVPSSLTPAPVSCAPNAAAKPALTPDAVRQLRLLKCLSDQLMQATAAYNRTRQSMRSTTRRLTDDSVAGRMSPSPPSPSLSRGRSGAPAASDADAAQERRLKAHHPRSATTPLLDKAPPIRESLGTSARPSPLQPPPPPRNPSSTGEASRTAHQRQQGSHPRRRKPGEPPVSASTGGSGEQTRIYRDPNGISPSVASENASTAAPGAVGGNSSSSILNEPPPPPSNRGAKRSAAAVDNTGERSGPQNVGEAPVKSRPRHAAKPSTTSVPPSASGGSHVGARHSGRDGAAASTPALSTSIPPSESPEEAATLRNYGRTGEVRGSATFGNSPRGGAGVCRTTAATPATPAVTSPLNATSSAVAAGPLPAMATPCHHATGAGGSALDMATLQPELSSPLPRNDTILVRGDAASEDAAGGVGILCGLARSSSSAGIRLLSPSLAAAEMAELEASGSTDPRQQRPQQRGSPKSKSDAGIGNAATAGKRAQASPRHRSSAAHKRESSLDILPGASAGSGSFYGNGELIPTSNTVSPPAGAGAGGYGTTSPSPHPARPGSGSLSANANAAAAATAAVRSTPRRPGEGAVWAVLVSRDEATIPSCCLSVHLGEEFRLGRSSKCTAVVSDSFVSSTQFSIVRTVSASTTQELQSPSSGRGERGARRGKSFTVTLYDRSANGTYVNVKKLGKDKSCVLRDKALITFRLSTSQFFLGFVFMLTDERGVPLDDRTGIGGGSALCSLLDARLSPRPLTGRRNNASITGGGGKESGSSPNTVVASPISMSASTARRNTPRALSTPDNSSFASATPNGSRRAGAPRSGRHAHRETIEWKIGEEMLGKGGNAEVYLGINLTNGQLIAVKRVRLPTCAHGRDAEQDPEAKAILQQYRSLQEEINVLSKATHPNIVQYYGSSQNSTYFNILLEFVPGGSLRHLLDNFGALSPGVILSYLHQALEGLAYLHRHNIVHSDFKAANILITEKGKVKLTDFGTARLLNRPHATAAAAAARGGGDPPSGTLRATSGQRSDDAVSLGAGGTLRVAGTLRWMDPALFHNTHSIGAADGTAAEGAAGPSGRPGGPTKAGDIWSVGCTLIEMMSGEAPWFEYDFESEEQIVNLLTYTAEPPEIPECPECPDLVIVAQTCLRMHPSQRPTCEALLRIVEEAMARLQAQSVSPSASPSREVSQQQAMTPGGASGSGAAVRSISAAIDPPMEQSAGVASASLSTNLAASHVPAPADHRQAERVGRPSDSTPVSFAMGGDDAGSSAPASAFGAASSTAF